MLQKKSIKNNRIIIRDIGKNTTIADTFVSDYTPGTNTVWVSATSLKGKTDGKVCVLIITEEQIYNFKGKMSGMVTANQIGIAVYPSEGNEVRQHERYKLVSQGEMEGISIFQEWIRLRRPIEIHTLNISADGILIQAPSDSVSLNGRFKLRLLPKAQPLVMECKVMRVQNLNLRMEEYGCKIVGINKKR